jgi:hypothetical protein
MNYPYILIPERIKSINTETPPIKPFLESEPIIKIPKKPKKVNYIHLSLLVITIVVVGSVLYRLLVVAVLPFSVVGAFLIPFYFWWQHQTYPRRKQEYNDKLDRNRLIQEDYQSKKDKYKEYVNEQKSPKRIAEYRKQKLLEILQKTTPGRINHINLPMGSWEPFFEIYLKEYFGNKIKLNLILQPINHDSNHPYESDFTYHDSNLNLYINIELDEPYSISAFAQPLDPVHFTENINERNRDKYFLNMNWIVIRFAEEQVARYPRRCCKEIAKLVNKITKDNSILNKFKGIPDLDKKSRWTQAQSEEMINIHYRNTYYVNFNNYLHQKGKTWEYQSKGLFEW